MSNKRSQRNTKKVLKKLKAKRQGFAPGGYGGGGGGTGPQGWNQNQTGQNYWTSNPRGSGGKGRFEYTMLEGKTADQREAILRYYDQPLTQQSTFSSSPETTSTVATTQGTTSPKTNDGNIDLTSNQLNLDISAPTQEGLDAVTKPSLTSVVWDSAKSIFVSAVTGAAIGALAGDYYGISKGALAKMGFVEGAKTDVVGQATGAVLNAMTGLPVVGDVIQSGMNLYDAAGNTISGIPSTFTGGSDTYIPDTSQITTNLNLGNYDSSGNIGFNGTVSSGSGTASSDNTIVTGGTVTSATNALNVNEQTSEDVGDSDMAENAGVTTIDLGGERPEVDANGRPTTPTVPDATESVVKTDKTLVTDSKDVVKLKDMDEVELTEDQLVSPNTLAPVAAGAAGTAAAAKTLETKTIKAKTNAETLAEADYKGPKAAVGEVSEGSLASVDDATLTTTATTAERDTEAEAAGMAEAPEFEMDLKSMVDPVTGAEITVSATPEAEANTREAITDDTYSTGEATQITDTIGYEITRTRPVQGEAAQGVAVDMLAEVGELPPKVATAILDDPEKVVAQLDNAPVEVKAAIAALPKEALMSSQIESLLGALEGGKTPVWARPAVDKVNAMMAERGLSVSTVGRDALFNAIIQSAMPIAENNANALQKRAAQNLDNQQQANITTATLDMDRRMNNLANQQTAASQTASMANDFKKLQGTFKQESIITTANQEQQTRLANLENRQRTAEQNNRNRQETMALNLGNEQQMTLANLEFEAQSDRDNMSADNQRKLAEMNVAAEFLSKNAELKQSMDIANMSNEQQMRMANLQARNDASADNLTAAQQTELANLDAKLKTNLKAADIASNMGIAQLNADQQRAVTNATTVANIDLAKFSAAEQIEITNSKFMQTMSLADFDAKNTAILQNAASQASMDVANLDKNAKLAAQNANAFLQTDLANLTNVQQANMLASQQEHQALLNDTSAVNAAAQFNATSENQTNEFMASLATQIDQFNVTQTDTMARFNAEQANKVNAENAGNQLQAEIANASLISETERFNANMQNSRDQWNASNAQTIQQGDLTWRRNANTADTAALNDANRLNISNSFNLDIAQHTQLWQEFRDEGTHANNNFENDQQRKVQLITSVISNEGAYASGGVATASSLLKVIESFDL